MCLESLLALSTVKANGQLVSQRLKYLFALLCFVLSVVPDYHEVLITLFH